MCFFNFLCMYSAHQYMYIFHPKRAILLKNRSKHYLWIESWRRNPSARLLSDQDRISKLRPFISHVPRLESRTSAFFLCYRHSIEPSNVKILWVGNVSMMFYSSSHECYKSFEVTNRRRVTLKTCSMNDLMCKTSCWDCQSHRICIVEKYNQAIITGQKTRQMNALSMQSGEYWLKVASIGSKWRRSIGFYSPL